MIKQERKPIMKKLLATLLLSCLCVSLTACGSNEPANEASTEAPQVVDTDNNTEPQEITTSNKEIKPADVVIEFKGYKFWVGMTIEDMVNQGLKIKADCGYIISDLTYLQEYDELDSEDFKEDFSNMTELLTECYAEDNYTPVYISLYYQDENNEWKNLSPYGSKDQISFTAHSFSEDPLKIMDCRVTDIETESKYLATALGLGLASDGLHTNYQDVIDAIGEPSRTEDNWRYFELSDGFQLSGTCKNSDDILFNLYSINVDYTKDFPE